LTQGAVARIWEALKMVKKLDVYNQFGVEVKLNVPPLGLLSNVYSADTNQGAFKMM
jgi:hypothetical protein